MTPTYIGPPQRRLFVITNPPQSGCEAAVLLCPPLGHEMVRAHRLLRVLAERLARNGALVLRFDPYGAGDSMGADEELDLEGWAQDLLTAHAHLAALANTTRIVWMGLRLGATVCAMAAERAVPAPRRLVLCDPVADGARYLDELRSRHVRMIDSALDVPPNPRALDRARTDPLSFQDEALGSGLSELLRRQLASLDGNQMIARVPMQAVVITDPASAAGARADAQGAQRLRFTPAAESVDWLSDLTEDGTLLPGRLSAQVMKEINDGGD